MAKKSLKDSIRESEAESAADEAEGEAGAVAVAEAGSDGADSKSGKRSVETARKEGRLLIKGVRKFLRYNRDLISAEHMEKIGKIREAFGIVLEDSSADATTIDHKARDLTRACEVSVPDYKPSIIRENIEVVFVAFVIAMGIRAYFLQPFKIPTGSMQPTLNGITGQVANADGVNTHTMADYEPPSILAKAWRRIWNGHRFVNVVAEEDGRLVFDGTGQVASSERSRFKIFTETLFYTDQGDAISVPAPDKAAKQLINPEIIGAGGFFQKGDVIARGYVETGDQVLVDKFSYHWRRPQRGQVFVFTTNGILGIESSPTFDRRFGSQHYIKRLAGVPGDNLTIEPPRLIINGQVAEEFGFRRVMSRENGYDGYKREGFYHTDVQLRDGQYFALGDNSGSSSDGRNWGFVPEENIVGRAVFVYWPFGQHFGRIR